MYNAEFVPPADRLLTAFHVDSRGQIHETPDDDFHGFAVGGRTAAIAAKPEVHPQGHRPLRNIDRRVRRGIGPCFYHPGVVADRLESLLRFEDDGGAAPDEGRGGVGPGHAEVEGGCADRGAGIGVHGVISVGPCGISPAGVFDVDLIRRIGADPGGRPVGIKPKHHVFIQFVNRAVDLPLVGPEPDIVGGKNLGAVPFAVCLRDFKVQIPACVHKHIRGAARVSPGEPPGGHIPGMPGPGYGDRMSGGERRAREQQRQQTEQRVSGHGISFVSRWVPVFLY